MTPHIAGWTEPTADHRWRFIAGNIDRIARGERPENVVWEPREQHF
jgi:phosphoglycerate dehydrogenase-like enzyme